MRSPRLKLKSRVAHTHTLRLYFFILIVKGYFMQKKNINAPALIIPFFCCNYYLMKSFYLFFIMFTRIEVLNYCVVARINKTSFYLRTAFLRKRTYNTE